MSGRSKPGSRRGANDGRERPPPSPHGWDYWAGAGGYLDIVRRAEEIEIGDTVVEAYRNIVSRLGRSPREFGEPMYHLRAMRMEVRNATVGPLYVEYGVHDEQPVVVIRRVRWLADPAG